MRLLSCVVRPVPARAGTSLRVAAPTSPIYDTPLMTDFDPSAYTPPPQRPRLRGLHARRARSRITGAARSPRPTTRSSRRRRSPTTRSTSTPSTPAPTGIPAVVINPMLVLCTVVGLSVEDLSEAGGPFLGVDELTFHARRLSGRHAHRREAPSCRRASPAPARRSASSRGAQRAATSAARLVVEYTAHEPRREARGGSA